MEFRRRQFLHLTATAAALPIVPAAALGQGTIVPTNATTIVERTQYFAKPGLAAAVAQSTTQALAPCAFRSAFQPAKYLLSIIVVMAASQMSRDSARSAM